MSPCVAFWLAVMPAATPLALASSSSVHSALAAPPAAVVASVTEAQSSYWGAIPAPSAENTSTFTNPRRKLWEYPVNLPYWVALAWPARALSEIGTEAIEVGEAIGAFAPEPPNLFPIQLGFGYIPFPSFGWSEASGFGTTIPIIVPTSEPGRDWAQIKLGGSTRGKNKATLGFDLPLDGRQSLGLGAGYRTKGSAAFFGIGPNSSEDDESEYRWETAWAGLSYTYDAAPETHRVTGAKVFANWNSAHAFGNDDVDDVQLSEAFADRLPVGYRDRSQGVTAGLELRHDTTEELGRPLRGGVRRGKVAYFHDVGGDDADFTTYRAELQQFIPLWHTYRTLGLRGVTSFIDPQSDGAIPFQRMLSNDEQDAFRGYPDDRFRDRGILALNVEYRWPLWVMRSHDDLGVDGVLFFDWGQVFEDADDISMDSMTRSYGFGLRGAIFGRFIGTLEVGFSEEGTQIRVSSDQLFQWMSASLFAGENPVPER